jgi:hypothetical protein
MNAPLHPPAPCAIPDASLPGLTDDAEDLRIAVEQLKLHARRLQAAGRDPTVLDGAVKEARAIVQDAAARVLALAMDAAKTAAEAPAAGGCA